MTKLAGDHDYLSPMMSLVRDVIRQEMGDVGWGEPRKPATVNETEFD